MIPMVDTSDFVVCSLCNKQFKRITNTHLWKEHRITLEDYQFRFPESNMICSSVRNAYGAFTKDKDYEQIYGKDCGRKLRKERSQDAIEQWKNPSNRDRVRAKTLGVPKSEEHCKKISEALTRNGANNYRRRALDYYGLECSRCGFTSTKEKDFHVHHRDLINIDVFGKVHDLENLEVLCQSCHRKLHALLQATSRDFLGLKDIEKGFHYVFQGMNRVFNLNLQDENFTDTPKRVARAYAEIFSGLKDTDKQVKEILSTKFKCGEYDEMIVCKNIKVYSMCPHHWLPVAYLIHIAYIPNKLVLGLSKLARLAEVLARRPVLQEKLTVDILNSLKKIKPLGAAVFVSGEHYCMKMRGVREDNAVVSTNALYGNFKSDSTVRHEFFSLVR